MIRLRAGELRYQAAIRGFDQRRLAMAAGISGATVSRALAGRPVRRGTLTRVARALQIEPVIEELVGIVVRDVPGREPPCPTPSGPARISL